MKQPKQQTYSLLEISERYNIAIETLRVKCQKLNYYPINHNGRFQYRLTKDEINKITDKKVRKIKGKKYKIPNVIYIHSIYEIYQSKINSDLFCGSE